MKTREQNKNRTEVLSAPDPKGREKLETAGIRQSASNTSSQNFSRYFPFLFGPLAGLAVVTFYLGLLTLTSDWASAWFQFAGYKWWIIALAVGLGIQASLYTYFRQVSARRGAKTAKSVLVASSGMSTTAMAACCSHYLVPLLPVLGLPFLSTIAASISGYQVYFFMFGVLSNLIGIGIMLRMIHKQSALPIPSLMRYRTNEA